ncbi:hypothetical protein [Streptomyces sp. NPDC056468]|uniref:hypothetical protein n=1 Tax=Streptomyces sp. NPDC056468 TaxID=3345830 RepID=UPI0036B23660
MTGQGKLISNWQLNVASTDPKWAGWSPFPSPPGATMRTMTGVSLQDGRPQLFAVTTEHGVFVTRKVNTNPDSAWSAWERFDVP